MSTSKKGTKYSNSWEQLPEFKQWLTAVGSDSSKAKCLWCNSEFSISHGGKNDVTAHSRRNKHVEILSSKITTPPVAKFFGIIYYSIVFLFFLFKSIIYDIL